MTKRDGQNRRRNYFIKKRFQASFILKFCLLLILACLIVSAFSYLLTEKTTTTSFENLRLTVKSTSDFILPVLISSSLAAMVLVSLATIVIVLFISHRIAGPLYKLEKSLVEMGKGDLTVDVHLRQADEIKVLADVLNKAVRDIREPLAASKTKADELEAETAAVKSALRAKGLSDEEIDRATKPLEKKIQQVKHSLSYFKFSFLLVFIFLFAASTVSANVAPEAEFSDGNDWSSIDSIFCTIYFKDGVDVGRVNKKIDTYRIDYGLTDKPPRSRSGAEGEIAYKFDLIFFKVQEILDMRPRGLHLKVRIYRGQDDLDRVYMEIFDQQNKFIAYYIFKLNTLFASEEKVSANVMAHEIAHCVVDHYFSVIPPTKVAEMIAQYADVNLRD